MADRVCDELPFAFGWIAAQPPKLERASHALADGDRVWVVEPVETPELDRRIERLGAPAGVIQLLERHARDGPSLSRRWGVPLLRAWADGVPGSPFEVLRAVDLPFWREAALWWPERRTLVVADALGTAGYFLAPGERLAVHPLLRVLPPRSLAQVAPEHVLCGHGEGVHGPEATVALRGALRTARRRTPRWLAGLFRRAKWI